MIPGMTEREQLTIDGQRRDSVADSTLEPG